MNNILFRIRIKRDKEGRLLFNGIEQKQFEADFSSIPEFSDFNLDIINCIRIEDPQTIVYFSKNADLIEAFYEGICSHYRMLNKWDSMFDSTSTLEPIASII